MKVSSLVYLTLILSFLLGIHEGKLALWRDGDSQPEIIFPCCTDLLPEADRKALSEGIPISSRQELAHLLEDYIS